MSGVTMTTTKTQLIYIIDRWDAKGHATEHVAEIDDLTVAMATYKVACERWPDDTLFLKQGSRVIADSRRTLA
jgi:hypothetical protein